MPGFPKSSKFGYFLNHICDDLLCLTWHCEACRGCTRICCFVAADCPFVHLNVLRGGVRMSLNLMYTCDELVRLPVLVAEPGPEIIVLLFVQWNIKTGIPETEHVIDLLVVDP